MLAARHNPFGAGHLGTIDYIPQKLSWEQLLIRLKELDSTAALVGPHGSGKTTLLKSLEKRLREAGIPTAMLFVSLDVALPWPVIRETVQSLPPYGVLCFDGACHLPFIRFRQLRYLIRKQHAGLIITSHDEGLLPTLIQCQPRLELLTELTCRLLKEKDAIAPSHLATLFETHKGNVRDCLWQLYDEYADNLPVFSSCR
ncbi:MAG: hypothetical protein GXY41_09595 [Phycisphaerae bacterium]|nr:hypothetical protein [Phycisphaerae bacterium]